MVFKVINMFILKLKIIVLHFPICDICSLVVFYQTFARLATLSTNKVGNRVTYVQRKCQYVYRKVYFMTIEKKYYIVLISYFT